MLRIPTFVAPSSIHGVGVHTAVPVPAGTIIWEFSPGVDWELSEEEVRGFPERIRSSLASYCYEDERGVFILCGDHARFMNHSDTPNCDDSGRYTTALHDIGAGEELTCDYRQFDVRCRAGSFDFEPWSASASEGRSVPA